MTCNRKYASPERREDFSRRSAYRWYLESDHWQRTRARVLRRDRHRCCTCGGNHLLQVHHLTYERLGRELLVDLETLCGSCHHVRHMQERRSARKAMRVPLERWWREQTNDPAGRSQSRSHPDRNAEVEARRARLDRERQDREKSRAERVVTQDEMRELGRGRHLA